MVKKINPYQMRAKLLALKGAFDKVPDDIAPSEDKGIYFYKAIEDLKKLIEIVNTCTYLNHKNRVE